MTNGVLYIVEMLCQQNILKIILLMKELNKKARYVDVSILLWFYPPGDFCVGLGVQASERNCKKIEI